MLKAISEIEALQFREFLRTINYDESALDESFGTSIPPAPHHEDHSNLLALARKAAPFHCVATLFFFGQPIESALAQTLFPKGMLPLAIKLGLVDDVDGILRPNVLLVPVGEMLFASDTYDAVSRDDGHYVPTLNQPAMHLADYAIRRPVKNSLDLCGGFALHAAIVSPASEQVITTDLNPRAKEFAEFNARLNGLSNIKAKTGNLFSAVDGETFDLIVCNPPFVISPSATTSFRENPMEMDGFVQEMIRQAPVYLEEGGFFQTICEWAELENETAADRIRGWTSDCGCDVWVIMANRQLPSNYARGRIREMTDDSDSQQSQLSQWEAYFSQRRVEAIHGGLIFLRKRSGENWFDATQINQSVTQPVGDSVVAGFACRDLLFRGDSVEILLKRRLRLSSDLMREQHCRWSGSKWQNESTTLSVRSGIPLSVGVDSNVLALIDELNGVESVAEALERFSKHLGAPLESVVELGVPMIRQLLLSGILSLE